MKSIFNIALALFLGTAACRPAPPPAPPAPADGSDMQRLVALLDYIASDYGGAVQDGRVTNPDEFAEQQRFVKDARGLADGLLQVGVTSSGGGSDPLQRGLEHLGELVSRHSDARDVAAACHALKSAAIERFGLRTAPTQRPSMSRAQALYAESCAVCHGASGDAETERARTLNPPPLNFRDADTRAKLSPYRVYNTLTFGIAGTSMASFESLPPEDRWSLAFYVLSLAHSGGTDTEGVAAAMPMTDLASYTDEELVAALRAQGHAAPQHGLQYLRTVLPFQEPGVASGIAETRARLRRVAAAYGAGQARDADRLVLDAYLQGFEPMEPHFRTRDPEGTAALEKEFHSVRAAIASGETRDVVQTRVAALDRRLADLAEPQRKVFPFVAAALIYLREGVEAALLVGALLAAVRRLGHPRAARYVHGGWIAAVPAGVLTWWVLDRLLSLDYAERELIEAGTALTAAAVLFWVSFWLISKADSRRWMDYLRRSVAASLTQQNLLVLTGLSFLAVYREAAETVLFTQVLLQESPDARAQVWAGAFCGLVVTLLLAILMRRAVLSLPIGPFFSISGTLLCLLAVSFAGSGLYMLVSAGYLHPRPVPFLEIPWMGVHPDLNGLVVQAAIVLTVILAGLATLVRAPGGETR